MSVYWHKFAKSLDDFNFRNWGFHDLLYFLFVVPLLPFFSYSEWLGFDNGEWIIIPWPLFIPPCLSWILLYGYVIIPNEPYVKFCKDAAAVGVGHRVRAFLSNETETWECPPKPGSTWVKQSIHKDWQCNETYCTADELASPESCHSATVVFHRWYNGQTLRDCDNWSEDNPGCCQNLYYGTYVECEYCIPDKTILWVISIFAGIATTIACLFWFKSALSLIEKKFEAAGEKAKKEAEEKAKKDTEAAKQGV